MAVASGGRGHATLDLRLAEASLVTGCHGRRLFAGTHAGKGNVLFVAVRITSLQGHRHVRVPLTFGGQGRRGADLLDKPKAVLLGELVLVVVACVIFLCGY